MAEIKAGDRVRWTETHGKGRKAVARAMTGTVKEVSRFGVHVEVDQGSAVRVVAIKRADDLEIQK